MGCKTEKKESGHQRQDDRQSNRVMVPLFFTLAKDGVIDLFACELILCNKDVHELIRDAQEGRREKRNQLMGVPSSRTVLKLEFQLNTK